MPKSADKSKYREIADVLRQRIRRSLKPGDSFPSQNQLLKELPCSLGTLNKALEILVSEGYLVRQQGRGTFVGDGPKVRAPEGKTMIAAVFAAPEISNVGSFYGQLVVGASQQASRMSMGLHLLSYNTRRDRLLDAFSHVPWDAFSGVLLIAIADYDGAMALKQRGITLCLADYRMSATGIDAVTLDNFGAFRELTAYAARLGHKRIAYFGTIHNTPSGEDREAGYWQGLDIAGIDRSAGRIFRTINGDSQNTYEVAETIVNMPMNGRPTALVIYDQWMAYVTAKALTERGISIPRDMSILCLGPKDTQSPPGIASFTMAEVEPYMLGVRGVELLFRRLNDPALPAQLEIVPYTIKPGASTGPPPE